MTATQHPSQLDGSTFTRRAWWSLLGFVPSLALAFLVGEGLIAALGYPSGGGEQAPGWAVLIAFTPALVAFLLPGVAAVHFGRRAIRLGDAGGRVPMVVAVVLAGGFLLLNAVPALITWLT